jgi:hypothetical protein
MRFAPNLLLNFRPAYTLVKRKALSPQPCAKVVVFVKGKMIWQLAEFTGLD